MTPNRAEQMVELRLLRRLRHWVNARIRELEGILGVPPCGVGLSPTVEPASSLDGSATSIPNAACLQCGGMHDQDPFACLEVPYGR